MPCIQLHVIRGRNCTLDLPCELAAEDVHKLVRQELQKNHLKLILKGKCLAADAKLVAFREGDTILVMPPRSTPPDHVSNISDPEPSPEDEDLKFSLPPDASPFQRRIAFFLSNRLHMPDVLMILLFSVKPRVWAMLLLWLVCSPIAARWDLGPVYILGTLFAIMLFNLGERKEGEASAYTLFNNLQPLPGQLNAEMLDEQLRQGRM